MTLRYLCLTTRSQQIGDIDTWYSRLAGDRPMWGPGFEGWDDSVDADSNLMRRFGRLGPFDAVFASFSFHFGDPFRQHFYPPTPRALGIKPLIAYLHETRYVLEFDPKRRRHVLANVKPFDIVLHSYDQSEMDPHFVDRELARWREPDSRLANQYIAQLPHHVRTDLFHPPKNESERDIDVLLVGRVEERLYDLRVRWARLIEQGAWSNALHQPVFYTQAGRWSEERIREQQDEFAALLRRARIVLTCSSHWRCMLQKFTEIAASGAFIVSDVPCGAPHQFADNIGAVSQSMSDLELKQVVDNWLAAPTERFARAQRLLKYVQQERSTQRFWARVDDAVRAWRTSHGANNR
ncbi:glycosyltransferase family 1 protein [Algiphilus sp. NNCM1]|nr:glycosyltransferase family 1 protein [Algiphilus acroporae]MCI5043575.1 glycosyltransferase [Aquisalinus sp.]